MTPEQIAALALRWVRFYTRNLPAPVAGRRIAEIEADLADHVAHERADGIGDRRIAWAIVSRLLRGVGADLAWRGVHRSVLRVALFVAVVLSLPLVATLTSDAVVWSTGDFVLAGALLATIGTAFELRRVGSRRLALGVGLLGVAAGLVGERGDAPGLVLLGMLLLVAAGSIGLRPPRLGR